MTTSESLAFTALYHACQEFVRKCDVGEARSKRSYAQMKAALTLADKAEEDKLLAQERELL